MTNQKNNKNKNKVNRKKSNGGGAQLVCSFCGKPELEVGKIILAGKNQKPICQQCIGICNQILDDAKL